jgi:phenylacetate-coenzyme A ligase PaaK-like adenylate-forming protein
VSFDLEVLHLHSPYSLSKIEKEKQILPILLELTNYHKQNNYLYYKIVDKYQNLFKFNSNEESFASIPYLPVQLFKSRELVSIPNPTVRLSSSGTSGRVVSQVFLDKDTSIRQAKVLTQILEDFIGKYKMPMLIIDMAEVLVKGNNFSARSAAILGFSRFAKTKDFALDSKGNLQVDKVLQFIELNGSEPFLVFGFTNFVWQNLITELMQAGIKLPKNSGILIHGGGWKRVSEISRVSKETFKSYSQEILGLCHIHDYYGMAEQSGSIFMECAFGNLHTSIYSEVLIRDPHSFRLLESGEQGLVQVLSVVPTSYPGHSILTEDIGTILGEDDCHCGRLGKYFFLAGRLPKSEARGCSDVSQW